MLIDHFPPLFPIACAAAGLFTIGGLNLLLLRCRVILRAAATAAGFGLGLAGAAALDQPDLVTRTAAVMAIGLVPFLLLGSHRTTRTMAAASLAVHKPAVRWSLLMIVAVAAALGSIVVFERADETAADAALAELESEYGRSPVRTPPHLHATTDRGTPLTLKEPAGSRDGIDLTGSEERLLRSARLEQQVIRRGPAGDQSNCHGWTFTGGRFLVGGDSVAVILAENGYEETTEPQPGDLVVYRNGEKILHTAVVRYVTAGQPVLVEGKWGNLGVFLHAADKCTYGTDFTYYRSPRDGHLLAGLGDPKPSGERPVTNDVTE